MKPVRIIGIDPGSRITGYGIIEIDRDRSRLVHHGVIRAAGEEFPVRLATIFTELQSVIGEFGPDQAAIETVFVAHNPSSALKLGQARGAAVCAAVSRGLPVSEYSPRSIKQAIVGRGGAEKHQVQHMVSILLRITQEIAGNITEDAADALAVALCHQHTQQTQINMERMRSQR